jgi:subtilase family serine protease
VGFGLGLLVLNPLAAWATDRPDLVVSTLGDPPATARAGDSFALMSTITNQGLAAAEVPTVTKFYLMVGATRVKNLKGTQAIAPLGPGESDGATVALSVYSDTDAGTYTLQACADGDGDVSEALENNNCKTTLATITILESPDLVVTQITNPVSSAGQGDVITAKSTIKNIGAVNADPTVTKYYLVSTTDGTKQDLKGSQNVPLLKPGSTFNGQGTVTIRPETPLGQYKLQACADSGKTSAEVDEQNNCLTSTGNIQVLPAPDLIVTSVTVPGLPTTVLPGAGLPITVVVTNQGTAQARASTMKFVLVNTASSAEKNLNGTASTPLVPAGGSVTVQKTVTVYSDTAAATYNVQACADSSKGVTESLESNNCGLADGALTVLGPSAGHSDLVVTAVTDPPATALPSAGFSIAATVMNNGTDPAPPTTTSFYLVNTSTGIKKSLKGGQSVPALAPGASDSSVVTITLFSDTIAATYFVQACADAPKNVSEEIETNNCANAAATLTVPKVPNLQVSSITNPPAVVTLGTSFNLGNSVRNVGLGAAATTSTKYYLVSTLDGTKKDLQGTQVVPPLNGGQTFSTQQTLTVREETLRGQYKVQACADGGHDAVESIEDDNCLTSGAIVKVVGPPDLIVTLVTVKNAPLSVARGGSLTITATVKNQGEGDAPPSRLKFLLVDTVSGAPKNLNGTKDYALIQPGLTSTQQQIVTVFLDTPVGTYVVQACADSLDVIPEASETNNCLTSTGTITVQ